MTIAERIKGGLQGLASTDLAELPAEALAVALVYLGDAIRACVPMPQALRREAQALPVDRLRGAVSFFIEDTWRWSLPTVVRADRDDPGLSWALRRRDEIESARVAIRSILIANGRLGDDLPEMGALEERLRAIDLTCGGQVSRGRACAELEARITLDGVDDWLDGFPEEERSAEEEADNDGFLAALAHTGAKYVEPSDSTVATYIRRGLLAKTVEAAAKTSPLFAERLADTIETLRAEGATVGLVARRWQAGHAGERAVVYGLPARRLAAADDEAVLSAPASLDVDLGVLAPVAAEARAVLTPDRITMHVYEEKDGSLSEVALGDAVIRTPTDGVWRIAIANPGAPIRFAVTGTDGVTFEQVLRFEPPTGG